MVHYFDEGEGPPLLLLHGNPTWSLIYREIVKGLRDRFRCIALDYPGFGLSTARNGYGYTPAEHAGIVERFRALAIGNTRAWPVNGDRHFEWFSKLLGGALGGFAIRNSRTRS